MTEKLYYKDAYQKECRAKIISCTPVETGYEIILDATIFYPEGGGQPGDRGMLGDVEIFDTIERNGIIIHKAAKALQQEEQVIGKIDWERRICYSRRHSGEHIFSGIVHKLFGFDNVGFHMGEDYVTVDFNGILSEEEILEVEKRTNEVIFLNQPINVFYPSKEEEKEISYRSKKEIEEQLRIVQIIGADTCACCGTHVQYTGEIGLLKVTAIENIRGGSRLTLKIGDLAYEDYHRKHMQIKQISSLLSTKPEESAKAVEKLMAQVNELKIQQLQIMEKLLEEKVKQIKNGSEQAVFIEEGLLPDEVRKMCDKLMERVVIAAVFSGTDEDGYHYVLGSKTQEVALKAKELNESLHGKGGGKGMMFQGKVAAKRNEIEAYFV